MHLVSHDAGSATATSWAQVQRSRLASTLRSTALYSDSETISYVHGNWGLLQTGAFAVARHVPA